jgi:multimeric flavodoxin WrbA
MNLREERASARDNEVIDVKVIAVSGSPRQGGNSDVAARIVLAALSDLGETEFIRVADYAVRHCSGCGGCRKLQQCVIQDDQFQELVAKWKEADLLIISNWRGSPLRYAGR